MTTRIAVCAPSTPITPEDAAAVGEIAAAFDVTIAFHPQCFASGGHFAGSDALRLTAFLECANDPAIDAVWFARGGYGAGRIAEDALSKLDPTARGKTWLGYSDAGYLLGGLYRHRIGQAVHAPMPIDVRRAGGEAAIRRVLGWLTGDHGGEEPGLDARPAAAFNLMTLAMLCGTSLMPDLSAHVVLVEEVSEHLYAVDRLFFHLTAQLGGIAGLRLGRVSQVPENDRPFGATVEDIARDWCARRGITFLGGADIGHDIDNAIVPFGLASRAGSQ